MICFLRSWPLENNIRWFPIHERLGESVCINWRRRAREKIFMYKFKVIHIPGEKNPASDATSQMKPIAAIDVDNCVPYIEEDIALEPPGDTIRLDTIRKHAQNDQNYRHLCQLIEEEFPTYKESVPPNLLKFWSLRERLYTSNDMIFTKGIPLIPKSLRTRMLDELHIGHQGVSSMKSNARQRFFWPGELWHSKQTFKLSEM